MGWGWRTEEFETDELAHGLLTSMRMSRAETVVPDGDRKRFLARASSGGRIKRKDKSRKRETMLTLVGRRAQTLLTLWDLR